MRFGFRRFAAGEALRVLAARIALARFCEMPWRRAILLDAALKPIPFLDLEDDLPRPLAIPRRYREPGVNVGDVFVGCLSFVFGFLLGLLLAYTLFVVYFDYLT